MSTTALRSDKILEARKENTPRGLGVAHPVVAHSATGATLTDVDGREYIDFVGGIGVMNVGHTHPRVVAAVKEQVERLSHPSIQVVTYERSHRLGDRDQTRSRKTQCPAELPRRARAIPLHSLRHLVRARPGGGASTQPSQRSVR